MTRCPNCTTFMEQLSAALTRFVEPETFRCAACGWGGVVRTVISPRVAGITARDVNHFENGPGA